MNTTPQIFITCLASYNNGHLHGKWVDADNIDTIHEAIKELKEKAPGEYSDEFFITDYDGFQGFEVREYHDLDEVATVAEFINNADDEEWSGFLYLFDVIGYRVEEAIEGANEVCFFHGTVAEYAEELVDDCYDLPEGASYYFDFEHFGHDLELNGDIYAVEHDILIINPQDF